MMILITALSRDSTEYTFNTSFSASLHTPKSEGIWIAFDRKNESDLLEKVKVVISFYPVPLQKSNSVIPMLQSNGRFVPN